MTKKKVYCDRCERELLWEYQQRLLEMSKEDLVRVIMGLKMEND